MLEKSSVIAFSIVLATCLKPWETNKNRFCLPTGLVRERVPEREREIAGLGSKECPLMGPFDTNCKVNGPTNHGAGFFPPPLPVCLSCRWISIDWDTLDVALSDSIPNCLPGNGFPDSAFVFACVGGCSIDCPCFFFLHSSFISPHHGVA